MSELTSQSRGGLYVDLGDGRGAVHESDLTKADRVACGLDAPEVKTKTKTPTVKEEVDSGR